MAARTVAPSAAPVGRCEVVGETMSAKVLVSKVTCMINPRAKLFEVHAKLRESPQQCAGPRQGSLPIGHDSPAAWGACA